MNFSLEPGGMTARTFKAWRAEQMLSQASVATLLGVHINTVQRWETGRNRVPRSTALAIETITEARQKVLRRLRRAQEELAYKRRMKAIAQGLRDKPKPKKPKPGEEPKRPPGNPNWIRAAAERRAADAAAKAQAAKRTRKAAS